MAERIISMRLALAGEKEVLARLEAVNASLAQSGEALASINEKSLMVHGNSVPSA